MEYGYLFIVMILGFLTLFAFSFYFKKNKIHNEEEGEKKFKWTYIFIGPYLFDLLNDELYGRKKLLNKRELIGWIVVLLILVIVFTFEL